MSADIDPIEALLASISDGQPIDWEAAADGASAERRPLVDSLHDVARIAEFSRSLQSQDDDELPGERWGEMLLLEPIGGGAQAVVFRAWDPKLRREVALKLLRSGADAGTLMDEGRAVARLRHPNVVTVHGIDLRQGRFGLWMELVRGTSLEQEVRNRGPLPDGEVVALGVQLASALAAVHEAGLLHRDVKPANVVKSHDGRSVLADFGLGLRWDRASLAADVSGTPMYMAPELLSGGSPSERTDVYSLGLLLWFARVGRHPFTARTLKELAAAAALGPTPTLEEARPGTPAELATIVNRAIAPDPAQRPAGARELLRSLERLQGRWPVESQPAGDTEATRPDASAKTRTMWGLVALLAIVALGAGLRAWRAETRASPETRFELSIPESLKPLGPVRVSPNGTAVAFAAMDSSGTARVYVRSFDALTVRAIPGTEGATRPFWSPDGRRLGFVADNKLEKVAVAGGRPEVVCAAPGGSDGCWTTRDMILFDGDHDYPTIRMVSARGGVPREITRMDTTRHELTHSWPEVLPDGEHFLYAVASTQRGLSEIRYARIGSNGSAVMPGTGRVEFVRPGFLLFVRDGELLAQRFDPTRGRLVGDPRPIVGGVGFNPDNSMPYFSASAQGTLVYSSEPQDQLHHVVRLDRAGKVIEELVPAARIASVAMSPDGRFVAYEQQDVSGQGPDLWIRDLARGVSSRFTTDPLNDLWPVWSADSRTLYWASSRGGRYRVFRRRIEDVAADSLFYGPPRDGIGPVDLSRDGRYLACMTSNPGMPPRDSWAVSIVDRKVVAIASDPDFSEGRPHFSPDGRWVVYDSDRTGRPEIYVQAFPGPSPPIRISSGGGWMAVWSPDGREIVYRSTTDEMMAVPITLTPRVSAGTPRLLFHLPMPFTEGGVGRFAFAPDGRGFIAAVDAGSETWRPIVITGWTKELK